MGNEICFGIPFKASSYTKALELAIKTINKFYSDSDIYLLVDSRNNELAVEFDKEKLLHMSDKIIIKKYPVMRRGDHKQVLVDWILEESNADIAIIMHSDVFFYKKEIIDILVDNLKRNSEAAFVCWNTPFVFYNSTFHIEEKAKRAFGVAPRISSWLFAICIPRYRELENSENLLRGHYWINNGGKCEIPIAENDLFWQWLYNEIPQSNNSDYEIILDIGTFLRYEYEKNKNIGICLGEKGNPNFDTIEMCYQPEGYVHIEQYDPERFNDILYSKDLLEQRTIAISKLLEGMV